MNINTNIANIQGALNTISVEKTAQASQTFKQYLDPETNKPLSISALDKQKIEKTAEEFETMFLTSMLEQMYSGVKLEKPFGGGNSENIYRSMLIGKYAETMSQDGGMGIASQLKDSITKMQLGI